MDRRSLYIKAQAASIAEVFGDRYGFPVQLDRKLSLLFLPRFPLPPRWGERETPLLIEIPAAYPDIPPNGFFLSARCNGPHVFSRVLHGGTTNFQHLGWNWFCVSCDRGWRAGPSPLEPCNLWTFLRVVQTSFSVNEF
jgi:hypothetical protein